MENKSEIKICQNCKKDFVIEQEDFNFYEKIKVPPPTFCPECRLQRRMIHRNERTLYKRTCNLCKKNIVSAYCGDVLFPVYCHDCWWGDKWSPLDYGKNYDFFEPFFEQFNKLSYQIPLCNVFNLNQVNSEYCNFTYQSKNCYLNFASDMNEDTGYLYHSIENKNSYDLLGSRKNENCYQILDSEICYNSKFLINCEGCIDSLFLYDCNNCSNCIGCAGLRNKKFFILNEKYTEEEYKKEIEKLELQKFSKNIYFLKKFNDLLTKYPRKFINSRHVVNCSGDYLKNAKNCLNCFDIEGPAKDLAHSIYGVTKIENIYDAYGFGVNVENCCDVLGAGDGVQNAFFSAYTFGGSFNCFCSNFSNSSSNCFGCVGLKNKSYCILNKQYTKEEYEELVPKIIKHMNDMPYKSKVKSYKVSKDKNGKEIKEEEIREIVYKYGEFFPPELSPFCYNETIAQEYFPLTKEEALEQGYRWKDKEERNYTIDIKNEDIPDNIEEVDESIINRVIECKNKGNEQTQCTEAFKIIEPEYQFYKRMNLLLPRLCPNCRHYDRLKQRNPLKLWHRQCMKEGCTNEFETSYAPDRPEIVYCEKCYQKEVY
ncbi:MAG: hypothetical protein WCX46_01065 [Candidatus Paceibacterota bacterium]